MTKRLPSRYLLRSSKRFHREEEEEKEALVDEKSSECETQFGRQNDTEAAVTGYGETTPSIKEYAPSTIEYAPSTIEYAPASEEYAPASEDYAPASEDYAPASEYYAPASEYYAPASEYYAPASECYAPASEEYAPSSIDYAQSSIDHAQSSIDYAQSSIDYAQSSKEYAKIVKASLDASMRDLEGDETRICVVVSEQEIINDEDFVAEQRGDSVILLSGGVDSALSIPSSIGREEIDLIERKLAFLSRNELIEVILDNRKVDRVLESVDNRYVIAMCKQKCMQSE